MLKRLVTVTATVLSVSVLGACGGDDTDTATDPNADASVDTVDCEFASDDAPAAEGVKPPETSGEAPGEVSTTLVTSAGEISATLDGESAPCTVRSFVSLAEQDYFTDTRCHRLTTQGIFVLQCGDPTATGTGGPGYTIPDELSGSETYPAGTLAMANTGMPDSGGSQFFIVYADTELPPSYTVFGQLDEPSIEVVQKIAEAGTDTGAPDGPPKEPVVIESVTVG